MKKENVTFGMPVYYNGENGVIYTQVISELFSQDNRNYYVLLAMVPNPVHIQYLI